MPDGEKSVTAKIVQRISAIPAAAWDACAGPDNPTVGHAFLNAMEESGSATEKTGWLPHHVAIEDADGRLIGCAPCYVKSHSYGEYVFDWGWAEAFERAGGSYYPKLQVSVPFTPVTGPRLLVRPGADVDAVRGALLAALSEIAKELKLSSLHITFTPEDEWKMLGAAGLLQRTGQQFHWTNPGYHSFDDFLAALSSDKRKMVRKERKVANAELVIETLTGETLTDKHMDAFFRFYLKTVDKKWAHAYLNREFFRQIRAEMADKIVLVMAFDNGQPAGGALNILGTETLYGRNWGAARHYDMLYFEACFYRAIEFAIAKRLKRVEAGAQGPHKIARGYLPSATYSAHWVRDANFRRAIEDFLRRERAKVAQEMEFLAERSPFKKSDHLPRDAGGE
jgi:predicted N-acyltransferase